MTDSILLTFNKFETEQQKMKHDLLINSKYVDNETVSSPNNNIQIFVKDIYGKTHLVYVNKSDKIIDVKRRFINKSFLKPSWNLYSNGKLLDDNETVENNEIDNQSVISIIGLLKGGMKIFVKNIEGKVLTFEISPNDSVLDLKYKVQEKTGSSPKTQKFVFQGSVLQDTELLKDVNITNECTVNMVLKPCDEITINILLEKDKAINLQISKSDYISDIKAKLQNETSYKVTDQVLLLNSEILQDNKKLNDYDIQDKETINLVINSSTNKAIYLFVAVVIFILAFEFLRFWNK